VLEVEDRAGGHAHTVDLTLDGKTVPVDTGCVSFQAVLAADSFMSHEGGQAKALFHIHLNSAYQSG